MFTLRGLVLGLALEGVLAFPAVVDTSDVSLQARGKAKPGCSTSKLCDKRVHVTDHEAIGDQDAAAAKVSKKRNNCGILCGPCSTFNAKEQYVSNTGKYAYASPKIDQVRGPCPGLNAAANHGYLPRSGVQTIAQTVEGLHKMYTMSAALGAFLAAYGIAFDGDLVTMTWSLGGPSPLQPTVGGLLGKPQGISYSHNKYEGDTSIGRCDAYTNDGDAHSLSIQRFKYAYESGMDDDRYTLDKFSQEFAKNTIRSERTNSHYFADLFSTTLVAPAAYNFVINFMSNHTAEEPAGYLNGKMFKEFFAVEGEYPNMKWLPGQERLPDNWYKRPLANPYNAIGGVFGDLISQFAAYPKTFRFGGNTAGTNTYTGIDIANVTGGALNAKTLLEGNNLACFFFQEQEQLVPDQLKGGVNDAAKAFALISKALGGIFSELQCPKLATVSNSIFDAYPGHKYSPKAHSGVATNC